MAWTLPDLAPQFGIVLVSHRDDHVRAYGAAVLDAGLLTFLAGLARDHSARLRVAIARRITDLPYQVQESRRRDRDARVRRAATADREEPVDRPAQSILEFDDTPRPKIDQ